MLYTLAITVSVMLSVVSVDEFSTCVSLESVDHSSEIDTLRYTFMNGCCHPPDLSTKFVVFHGNILASLK